MDRVAGLEAGQVRVSKGIFIFIFIFIFKGLTCALDTEQVHRNAET